MRAKEKTAIDFLNRNGLSRKTLRTWRHRGERKYGAGWYDVPSQYTQPEKKVLLSSMLPSATIESAARNSGDEKPFRELLQTRIFKAGQAQAYYYACLKSLVNEIKRKQKQQAK